MNMAEYDEKSNGGEDCGSGSLKYESWHDANFVVMTNHGARGDKLGIMVTPGFQYYVIWQV